MTTLQSDSTIGSSSSATLPLTTLHVAAPTSSKAPVLGLRDKLSIRVLIVTVFVIPIVGAVGLTGWLSIRNGQQAVSELAGKLQTEASKRVSVHLDSYLSVPHQVNQINMDAVELGMVSLQDFNKLGKYFWRQMKVFDIGYSNFANKDGEFIGVERLDNGNLLINEVSQVSTGGKLHVYQTDQAGDRTKLDSVKTYDPREEAWYADAARIGKPLWTQIYQWEDKPEIMSISSSFPVYAAGGKFVGVIGIDLILTQISSFLNTLNVSPSAKVFIIEQNGLMVANSGKEPAYKVVQGKPQRVSAENSTDPLISAAAQYLKTTYGVPGNIKNSQLTSFNFKGERQFVQVTPWKDQWGLDWRIVVVTAESDFMAQINTNTRNTIALCGVALVLSTLLGLMASRHLTSPLVRLSQASQAIASGDLNQTVAVEGLGEMRVLSRSFNQMATQLRESFTALETVNKELEQRVAERTATLHEEGQALQHEVGHLLDVVSAVEEGDLTIEAEVSPRVTGLVGDTLNRLIMRLGQVMAEVLNAAERVTHGTTYLEQLAVSVADNVQHQFQSVAEVQTLMEEVNNQAQEAALQAIATGDAVQLTQAAISEGQYEITAMTQGIQGLRQETDQIVKRTQTLTNYVELATQFVKDQKRIAAMTRILAVNASMLSNRATVQQDPEQMAVITHEFETIAAQVNQLAAQTNQSLILLQQRTDQIQTVVSGLNYDVQGISQQVSQFTVGVEQSQQAFQTIRTVSERVAQMGQQVTQSSQVIAGAAQTTLQSVRDIASSSAETLQRANVTQEQAEQMEQLAQSLLRNVEFFQLRPEQLISRPEQLISPDSEPQRALAPAVLATK
ncbi:MAG: methyl-accepting chemotaxis protein [Lyngbya sp. HA4199-MV5]|jgi:methyl-accepting chemotaxis protein|nr:methyl-accepting chemotaxis protein [Lyngbya sp. HA4199-MV5]